MHLSKSDIAVIILTYNEAIHIQRVIVSAQAVSDHVIIIDSFSSDDTVSRAQALGATVFQHPFKTQAEQVKWAMENCNIQTPWTLRMDADEYLTPELVNEILTRLPTLPQTVSGVFFKRRVHFMGKWIRHGGYYPIKLLRLWRTHHARIEQRWMDEHTYLTQGDAIEFQFDIVDDNLNNLAWWTEKHNNYSTREAVEILLSKHREEHADNTSGLGKQVSRKRWYKENLYLRLPLFLRCMLYYQYRYWIGLGFLDGKHGLVFHFLQALWYRVLVDAKIWQIQMLVRKENMTVPEAILRKFAIKLTSQV